MEDDRTTGKVFNLGSGINYSVNDIFDIVADLTKSNILPKFLDDLPGEAFQNLADISEARKIGWIPKTDLKIGMKTSIEYIRKELETGKI